MKKNTILISLFLLLNCCSFNENSQFWTENKSKKEIIQKELERIFKNLNNIEHFNINQGDILLMNLDMVHRSGKNISNKFRITLLGRYHNSKSNDFNPGLNLYKYANKNINRKIHGF